MKNDIFQTLTIKNYSTENQRMSPEKWWLEDGSFPFGMVYLHLFFGPTFFVETKIPHQNVVFVGKRSVSRPSVTLPPWLAETQDPHEKLRSYVLIPQYGFPHINFFWSLILMGAILATWKGLCSPKSHTKWISIVFIC